MLKYNRRDNYGKETKKEKCLTLKNNGYEKDDLPRRICYHDGNGQHGC